MDPKIILVTGGNRGIGKEICRQLAELGHQVLLSARSLAKAQTAAAELSGKVNPIELDVSRPESISAAAATLVQNQPRLDVLINNAAIMDGDTSGLREVNPEDLKRVFETNFFGPMRLNQALLPLLFKSPEGRIINLSSGMGAYTDLHLGGYASYRLSKAGLNAQTQLLAGELSGTSVKVNAMCPGWVKTEMGGSNAPRPVEKGAETAVWLATAPEIPNGKFLRDKTEIEW